ncbi:MAG: replication initiation protein RepC, partial [Proteobacteria bacterium]|nr:replication initiation protein RepC [Pseudomonadota bacterium]
MSGFSPATPFGARTASLGHLATRDLVATAAQAARTAGANGAATVNKWAVFRALAAAARPLGLADRTLALLNALLSFHPETAMTLPEPDGPCADLVVYPSNRALSARAHGMAEKTMRRHLAALVEAGLIIRRDSPNGKRYARRGEEADTAFGFDLGPLVARAGEFEALAEAERLRQRQAARLRETVSLLRRDVLKLVALGLETGRAGPWEDYRLALMGLMVPLRRLGDDSARLESLRASLDALRTDVLDCLSHNTDGQEMTGNAGDSDRHKTNSNPQASQILEPATEKSRG